MNKAQYAEYLQSEEWGALKAKKETRRSCSACLQAKPLQAHHMLYRDTPQDTKPKDLLWLCGDCHKIFHESFGLKIARPTRNTGAVRKRTVDLIRVELYKRDLWKMGWIPVVRESNVTCLKIVRAGRRSIPAR